MTSISDLLHDPIKHYPLATVACFDPTSGSLPRRSLDKERTTRFLENLAAAGAPALLIGASTGHGHARTPAELLEWFTCAGQINRQGAVLMALLRPEDGDDENERILGELAQLEYEVVFVRPGTNLPNDATDEQIANNMSGIVHSAAANGLAVGLYSIPDVSGLPMSTAVALSLTQRDGGDNIVAIKVTEADYDSSTRAFLEDDLLERLKIVQGWDPFMARALRDGGPRCGVTSGPMSFAVYQYMHILSAAQRGDWEEVAAAQQAVTQLFESMQDDPRKFADLQRAKVVMGLGQPLLGEITEPQVDRLLAALSHVVRDDDRSRLARSLDLMGDGPYHPDLAAHYQVT